MPKIKISQVIPFIISLVIFFIPTIMVSSMKLQTEAGANDYDGFNWDWIPVTAAIYLSKCICYTIAVIVFYKGLQPLLKDKE
ncbi:hypothetical protein [Aminipila luticellarii]|uniref:Uncharacterized protein n=1 Tax=Aminipila luticellarii TaxID=2507160 RepID=A0A410PYD7_9FIRM|nr:hypothetical protein [Aminipila luticellarii]QAT43973.1 hypothetical protein EQM06_12490 [Aminipila luticellarii]